MRRDLEESRETDIHLTVRVKTYQEILNSFRYIYEEGEVANFEAEVDYADKKYDTQVRAKQF